jgi:succinate dehydrogenase/fumarate reductase flavoprotein subunit
MSLRATGTRDGSASGWVLAYDAGAKLQNIEMQWHHASDVAYPASWMRLHLYPNPLPGTEHRSQLFNSDGDMFFDSNWLPENPVPYIMQLKYLAKEVKAGKARLDGGFYSNFRHVEKESLENYIYQTQFAKKVGIDLSQEMYENAVTWHMNVGGVRVNGLTMESDVEGLLAAGSVAALVTGGLANSMYEGLTAAKTAGQRALEHATVPELDDEQVAEEEARVLGLLRTEPRDGLLPGQVKKRIRRAMWEHMNYVKTEASMRQAEAELDRIVDEDLPRMRVETDTRRFNYDWVEALDAADMVRALQIQVKFSLHRKESRGGFYREDYPMTDNTNWLRHLVGSRNGDGELTLDMEPVALPYAVPDEEIASFFDVDY